MARSNNNPPSAPKVTDLLIRQKTEALIEYGYVCLRQFPQYERHVLAAEIRWMGERGPDQEVVSGLPRPVGLEEGV